MIDSHAHLDGPKFDADFEAVLGRAAAAGVEDILTIGNGRGPDDVDCALRVAERAAAIPGAPRIHASLGVHPHEAALATEAHFARMAELARDTRIVAWGEVGLDYFYDHSPRPVQQAVFVRQMELAGAAGLPIIIHCRPSNGSEDAFSDCFSLLREHWAPHGLPGIMHCFTGEVAHAQAALDLGFLVSFAGNVTFPKAENIRQAARMVPLDRLLIETDSPYLAPVPHRGQRNEPAFVAETARYIAGLRGLEPERLAAQAAENFRALISRGSSWS